MRRGRNQWIRHLRRRALVRQHGRCRYCGDPLTVATSTLDHRKPRSRGGATTPSNTDALCGRCNRLKGIMRAGTYARWLREWRPGGPFGRNLDLGLAAAGYRIDQALRRMERRLRAATGRTAPPDRAHERDGASRSRPRPQVEEQRRRNSGMQP